MKALLRTLFARPSYALTSIAVLAVGIAAQLDLAAIVDATLLRPPSGRSPSELAYVRSSLRRGIMSYPDYLDIRQRNTFFSDTFACASWMRAGLTHDQAKEGATCGVVSGNFLPALGIKPAQGRLLLESDDVKGADPVALVSPRLAERLGLALGSIVKINGAPFTVVGIMPEDYRGIERDTHPEIWLTCAQAPILDRHRDGLINDRNLDWIWVAGRLKPGVDLARAQAELGAIARQLQKENPVTNAGMDLKLDSFAQFQFFENDGARTMLLISGIVWFLFALAFANFFSLTLLRILTRRRELAIKLALGATRGDIGAGLLGEMALLLALALGAGYGLARIFLLGLRLDPTIARLAQNAHLELGWRPAAFVGLLVLAAALAVWLLALRAACRVDLQLATKERSSAPRRRRAVTALYALQFAIALFLLSVAASFIGTLRAVAIRQLPFRTENLLLLDVNFRSAGVTGPKARELLTALIGATREVPGVIAVGGNTAPLMVPGGWTNLIIDGRDPALDADKDFCRWNDVTADFWKAAGIPLLSGRLFTEAETAAAGPVGVINAAAARRFWPKQDAVGHAFRPFPTSPLITVIGVVADVPQSSSALVEPLYYRPPPIGGVDHTTLHIAVRGDSAAMRESIRRRLQPLWPSGSPPALRSIRDQIDLASADLLSAVRLVLWVAAFALFVTGGGLYFFSAYTASQNLRDSAIRLALGARSGDLLAAHLRTYRPGLVGGAVLAAALLAAVRPIFHQLNTAAEPPGILVAFLASIPLLAIALGGLYAPLIRVGRLDINRTLGLPD